MSVCNKNFTETNKELIGNYDSVQKLLKKENYYNLDLQKLTSASCLLKAM